MKNFILPSNSKNVQKMVFPSAILLLILIATLSLLLIIFTLNFPVINFFLGDRVNLLDLQYLVRFSMLFIS